MLTYWPGDAWYGPSSEKNGMLLSMTIYLGVQVYHTGAYRSK